MGKERKDFLLPLRELWLPLTYSLFLSFKLHIINYFGVFRKTAHIPIPCHFISIHPYDCLFTNILCREGTKETSRFLHHGHFWSEVSPIQSVSTTFIFLHVLWSSVCSFRYFPQKHPSQGKVFTLQGKMALGLSVCICKSCCIYSPFLLQSILSNTP